MKRIILFILTSIILFSCSDDEKIIFDADPSDAQITFEAFAGGAYMNYVLPDNSNIQLIQAVYTDHYGKEINLKGSYTNNKLKLIGFVNQEDEIPVEISFLDHDDNVSKTITKYFSTGVSGAKHIFEDLTVRSYWDGFHIKYSVDKKVDGFLNIGFIGINPNTKKMDTLLTETRPIMQCTDENYYFTKIEDPTMQNVNVVIWTDDFRGNRVKKVVYKDIKIAKSSQINLDGVGFDGASEENEAKRRGYLYLFDGDKTGYKSYEENDKNRNFCFMSTPNAVPGYWTLDLHESKKLAFVRLYTHLNYRCPTKEGEQSSYIVPFHGPKTKDGFLKYTPNNFKVYGSNNPSAPIDEWVELGEYYQTPSADHKNRWTWRAVAGDEQYAELDALAEAEPNYIQLNFDVPEVGYRYLRLEVIETYKLRDKDDLLEDSEGRFYIEELEVFEKMENE